MRPNVESPFGSQSPTSRCTDSSLRTAIVPLLLFDFFHLIQHVLYCSRDNATTLSTPRGTVGHIIHLRGYCQVFKTGFRALHGILVVQVQQILQLTLSQMRCWCAQWDRNSISGSVLDILWQNYIMMAILICSSPNSYRFTISSIHKYIEGYPVGQHPQVIHTLKGAYNLRPPTPKYSNTWKMNIVVTWLDSIELSNKKLPLIEPSTKTVLLLSLTRLLHLADLGNFLLPNLKYHQNGCFHASMSTSG